MLAHNVEISILFWWGKSNYVIRLGGLHIGLFKPYLILLILIHPLDNEVEPTIGRHTCGMHLIIGTRKLQILAHKEFVGRNILGQQFVDACVGLPVWRCYPLLRDVANLT